ncbi:hypothetical protein LTR56_020697 [Elasticomyces elasticus]|nr:hypothetical protein LTR56_020697 [Elasticomyces elasticus]KAK4901908.1 hypothetical protein LTR49_027173 [Elasticomyces elasticus]KAK5747623.1 hypothetical protein LTS12_022321 [Elasticomyces elasticus]
MVLTDDNFASIISAIRDRRRLFDNIQKFLLHLLIPNISQVILLLVGLAFQDRDGISVFPLSPIEIFSSTALSWAVSYLVSYLIVVFGNRNGDLGHDCNENFNASCDLAYRACGTAYAIPTVLLLVMALEAKHLTHNLFNLDPGSESVELLSQLRMIARNLFLFFAALGGLITPIPIIYIPVINRVVFRHDHLGGPEWGLVFTGLFCFVALAEAWKAVKRRALRRRAVNEMKTTSEGSSFA